jgi:hypothetical protein
MLCALLLSFAAVVSAGSIEISSSDLSSSDKSLDNIKASWSQVFSSKLIPGSDTKLTAKYDRKERKDFVSEATLSGTLDKIKYAITTKFQGGVATEVETTTSDGTTFVAEGSLDDVSTLSNIKLTKVTATRKLSLSNLLSGGTQDCNLEVSHDVPASESKVKLSSVLGSGVTASGELTSSSGSSSLTYEVEYDTTLSEGRTLHATVVPGAGTGEIEYEDSATLDATITATLPIGGTPSVTVKRSFGF